MGKKTGPDPAEVELLLAAAPPEGSLGECHAWLHGPAEAPMPTVPMEQLLATVEAAIQRNAGDHLERLRERSVPKGVRKAASRGVHTLRSRGIVVEAQRTPHNFSLQGTEIDRLESAWFAQFHAGLWHVFLTASDGQHSIALTAVVHGPGAIESMQHSHTTRSGIKKAWRRWATDDFLVRYDFDLALGILDSAVAASFGPTQVPEDWRHFLQTIERARLTQAQGVDWVATLPSEFERADLGTPDEIRSETHRRILLLDDEARGRLLERMLEVANSELEIVGTTKADRIRDALLDELDALLDDEAVRADWVGRLNLTALHAKQAQDGEGLKLFRASALALSQGYRARQVPILSRLIEPFTTYGQGGPMPDLRPAAIPEGTSLLLPEGHGHD